MVELTRTNDPVLLSWLMHALAGDGIEAVVLDTHTSILEGSVGAIPRRVMVLADDLAKARVVLHEGEMRGRS
ncbi:MAG: putative signal transducing protein [Alphaproteobacteria bacterium]